MVDVLDIRDCDRTRIGLVGGKAAHLGELCHVEGIAVPPGFCVTTDAFWRVLSTASDLESLLAELERADDPGTLSAAVRETIGGLQIPDDLTAGIIEAIDALGADIGCAVRSSATVEDMPTASAAGQHDTFLDVVGAQAIFEGIRRCWVSLYSDRAVAYRRRQGASGRKIGMAVIVQEMVAARVAGVVFTAHPVNGNRTVTTVEASRGLGEALVSGTVDPDVFEVRNGQIVTTKIGVEQRASDSSPAGHAHLGDVGTGRRIEAALTHAQVLELAGVGRRIEALFGHPQDIEWCLDDVGFHILQTRPITTVFPTPPVDDDQNHVYLSVGHNQMMTDAMKPLGLSVWLHTTRAPMLEAGSRLFVDVTQQLASPATRAGLMQMAGRSDPLTGDALQAIVDRGDFLPPSANEGAGKQAAPRPPAVEPIATDPGIVAGLIDRSRSSIQALEIAIAGRSGPDLIEFIRSDLQQLKEQLFDPINGQAVMASVQAMWWLNEQLETWLGEKNAADTLVRSVDHNVSSEMGIVLLDVADVIRPHPEVVAFLRTAGDDFLDRLPQLEGGPEALKAITSYLDAYGMRCAGEIDITRPRWSERPTALVPLLLNNIEQFAPGAARRRFEEGRALATEKERELLERLEALPDGEQKAGETKQMIDRLRTFAGYREYPKYAMVSRYFIYKRALLGEAARLASAGVLGDTDDIFYLRLDELDDVVRTNRLDTELIAHRKEAFAANESLTPPRVLTSEGEAVEGTLGRERAPAGALVGVPVSTGIVEGRARVVLDMSEADLVAGDIVVTRHADPSWSPLFVAIAALVTEVGGQVSHGSVVAREFGLPAVVGVRDATRRIRDGQRIRVNGTGGYVEILPPYDA